MNDPRNDDNEVPQELAAPRYMQCSSIKVLTPTTRGFYQLIPASPDVRTANSHLSVILILISTGSCTVLKDNNLVKSWVSLDEDLKELRYQTRLLWSRKCCGTSNPFITISHKRASVHGIRNLFLSRNFWPVCYNWPIKFVSLFPVWMWLLWDLPCSSYRHSLPNLEKTAQHEEFTVHSSPSCPPSLTNSM